ncbi:MAG: L-histidine N(alpha)-methyltransferase [Gemmataceae bacterium]
MIATLGHELDTFRTDVLTGLSRPQKRLPSKYFYDESGSRLFDSITRLDEYYPTRTELGIMERHGHNMAERLGPHCLLIEFGGGSLVKIRTLLDHLEQPAGYVPVDVSGPHLVRAADQLELDYPGLDVMPVCADFTGDFPLPGDMTGARRVVYFPGSTIGNFDPPDAETLLRHIAQIVGSGGGLLLGVDLQKSPSIIEPAYNDRRGVTAAFNRNILIRINRELDANFDPDAFKHCAFYNQVSSRVEMHLVSERKQRVRVSDQFFRFEIGESIHTENSYKYDPLELAHLAARCGLKMETAWYDEHRYFGVMYLVAN